jgi:branched-chain amino acid aminotransferase
MRDTIIACAPDVGVAVEETPLNIDTVLEEIRTGTITEAIACGTAAALTGISAFVKESGEKIAVGATAPGPVTSMLYEYIQGIQRGLRPDTRGWLDFV